MIRLPCQLKLCVGVTVISLYIVVFLVKNDVSRYIQNLNSQLDVLRPPPLPVSTQSKVAEVPRGTPVSGELKCEPDRSAGDFKGFSELKPHIQDFLLYRHCRRFRLLLDVPQKCGAAAEDSAGVFLLLVIKTSPWNYERREVLRSTWAAERQENGAVVRRVFLAGTAAGGEERQRTDELLRVENHRYGDILQWDFIDSFFNLTLKQLLFLDWMEERCPHVHFLLNGDEDIFANTDNMVHYLQAREDPQDSRQHLYVGQVLRDTKPVRWTKSKYYIPTQVYAAEIFPPYITGGGFLISGYTAHVVYNMSFAVPIIPIDDAYIGMCVEKAGLQPEAHVGVLAVGEKVVPKRIYSMDPCVYRDLILAHGFLPYEILVMWERIHSSDLKCGILNKY
ncbi:N-acetyllactosaminide beta-1,3-N-acetylglucosaminyltransferase 3-like [Megalops cyprinoides]|uniref:N-acetyllactosaminide beta-1,3-N-acetylglucosaminyltransferase 3-like n=1 Tax=Megalops cyprinoides TaxID=118141 RepID=UPI001863CA56|nr:N-acetyllactosaminide beta-1,3-N-acetylglucosaminyltransferase 3-like [Megalops cyprinoides]